MVFGSQPQVSDTPVPVTCYWIVSSVRLKCCAFKQQISSHSISLNVFFSVLSAVQGIQSRGLPTSNKVINITITSPEEINGSFSLLCYWHLILIEKLSITVKSTDNLFCYTCCRACCHLDRGDPAILLLQSCTNKVGASYLAQLVWNLNILKLGIYIKHIPAFVSIDTYSCLKPQSTQQQASERNKTE